MFLNTFSPQGDGNTYYRIQSFFGQFRSLIPFPRKGTETSHWRSPRFHWQLAWFLNTFSPQGDGNTFSYRILSKKLRSLIPFPRKGTETGFLHNKLHGFLLAKFLNTFSPQGDGNDNMIATSLHGSSIGSLIPFPRKGTETPPTSIEVADTTAKKI